MKLNYCCKAMAKVVRRDRELIAYNVLVTRKRDGVKLHMVRNIGTRNDPDWRVVKRCDLCESDKVLRVI